MGEKKEEQSNGVASELSQRSEFSARQVPTPDDYLSPGLSAWTREIYLDFVKEFAIHPLLYSSTNPSAGKLFYAGYKGWTNYTGGDVGDSGENPGSDRHYPRRCTCPKVCPDRQFIHVLISLLSKQPGRIWTVRYAMALEILYFN
jgi:hypothetical protein